MEELTWLRKQHESVKDILSENVKFLQFPLHTRKSTLRLPGINAGACSGLTLSALSAVEQVRLCPFVWRIEGLI